MPSVKPATVSYDYPKLKGAEFEVDCKWDELARVRNPFPVLEALVDDARGFREKEIAEEWLNKQKEFSSKSLDGLELRDELASMIQKIHMRDIIRTPIQRPGGKVSYTVFPADRQDQCFIYVTDDMAGSDKPEILLSREKLRNELMKEGPEWQTVTWISPVWSKDGSLLAIPTSYNGSDRKVIRFLDVKTGELKEERIDNVMKPSMTFAYDGKGLFYTNETHHEGEKGHYLFYHQMGGDQKDDIIVYKHRDSKLSGYVRSSKCGDYLYLTEQESTGLRCGYKFCGDMKSKDMSVSKDLHFTDINSTRRVTQTGGGKPEWLGNMTYVANNSTRCVFSVQTYKQPYGALKLIDLDDPNQTEQEVVAERHGMVLDEVVMTGDLNKCVIKYVNKEAHRHELVMMDLSAPDAAPRLIELGEENSSIIMSNLHDNGNLYIKINSYTSPPNTIYICNIHDPALNVQQCESPYLKFKPIEGYDPSLYESRSAKYRSADGEEIGMVMSHKKTVNIRMNCDTPGDIPVLIQGYGNHGVSLMPRFSPVDALWMQCFEGIVCHINIRGGGEDGFLKAVAASGKHKQKSIDDFAYAAKYLIDNKITIAERIAIYGVSGGGAMAAAAVNQHPKCFGAAILQVHTADLLNFHRYGKGHLWRDNYGDPEKKEDFQRLLKISPLHNIKGSNTYPCTMVVAASKDDRSSPLHVYKYIAKLQHETRHQTEKRLMPHLMRVFNTGHFIGSKDEDRIRLVTDIIMYCKKAMNLDWKAPWAGNSGK